MNKAIEQLSYYLFPIFEIAKRDLQSFFKTYMGWFILFFAALLNGIFGWYAIQKKVESAEALQMIFYFFSGTSMISGILIGMRLFSEEKLLGTLELLMTSAVSNHQLVISKYIVANIFIMAILLISFPVPLIVYIWGNPNIGHLFSGYVGNILIAGTVTSIAMFYSTLTKIQLLAAVMASTNIVLLLLCGFFSPYIDAPMKNILRELSLYVHYRDFEAGVLVFRHFLFFVSMTIFYLYLSVIALRTQSI